jgi:hypothetical protein
VIWCTGFDNGLSWIDLPIFEENGEPRHTSGLVEASQDSTSSASTFSTPSRPR